MDLAEWSLIIAAISLGCTILGLIATVIKMRNDRRNFERQLNALQQLIGLLREQVAILKDGLEKRTQNGTWEKNFKEKELEMKRRKDEWARMKDMASFLRYAFENQ